mmetsp:Transcript_66294/g.194422  ORF Transcript_66294/g.194422 Transcript_66294/m.194422 type:complete len:383 (+) Transcript_66294:68-1216(+)
MSFLKGARENPGQVVTTGEHHRTGKAPVVPLKVGADGAKGLIYGDEEHVGGRPWRPTPQQAPQRVDTRTGPPPPVILSSKLGTHRDRRPPDAEEADRLRKFHEESAQAFQDARALNQQNKHGQATRANPLKEEKKSTPRPLREQPPPAQVDPELTAMFAGIEEAATMQRMSVDDAVDPYLQSRVAATQQRTKGRGEGIFPEAAPESPAAHERVTPKAAFTDEQAASNYADARLAREQASGRNRRSENVICGGYVSDQPGRKEAAFTNEQAANQYSAAKQSREQALGRNRRSENIICGDDVPVDGPQVSPGAFTNEQAAHNFADAKLAREQAMGRARTEGIFAEGPAQKPPAPRVASTNIISHDGSLPKGPAAARGPSTCPWS